MQNAIERFAGPAFALAVVALVALPVLGHIACASVQSKRDSFTHWTRYYETRMGLEETTEIRFESPPDFPCGQVVWEQTIDEHGPTLQLVTYYDPERLLCKAPWDVAGHEAAHRRMQHHRMSKEFVKLAGIDTEKEAAACLDRYRP